MTDHAAEAISYSNQGYADLAQIHATLALVEQQKRIADVLEVISVIRPHGGALAVEVAG